MRCFCSRPYFLQFRTLCFNSLRVLMMLTVGTPVMNGMADTVTVAVASNFTRVMEHIATDFESQSGHTIRVASGSSGKLLAQIRHGAPFDLFLSADQAKPAALISSGHAIDNSQFTYAIGTLVLWSATPKIDVLQQLRSTNQQRIAMANPRLAPYGLAAQQTLDSLGINIAPNHRVMGENINQTWQFVATGNALLGFVALSQIIQDDGRTPGSAWPVPQEYHQPIRQDAVLLSETPAARQLWRYLQSPAARQPIKTAGYRLPTIGEPRP